MKHYEVMRYAFEITDENANKIIREQVFNNLNPNITQEKRKEMFNKQKAFVNSLRDQMEEGKILEDIAKYKNKIMVVIASSNKDNEYVAIIFDKEVTGERYSIKIDAELDKVYIEDGGILNE